MVLKSTLGPTISSVLGLECGVGCGCGVVGVGGCGLWVWVVGVGMVVGAGCGCGLWVWAWAWAEKQAHMEEGLTKSGARLVTVAGGGWTEEGLVDEESF